MRTGQQQANSPAKNSSAGPEASSRVSDSHPQPAQHHSRLGARRTQPPPPLPKPAPSDTTFSASPKSTDTAAANAPPKARPAPLRRRFFFRAAAEPKTVAQRMQDRFSLRRAMREHLRFAPSWLFSVVLHALLMVTLGSLAVATGGDNFVMELVLTRGNSAQADDAALDSAGSEVSVTLLEAAAGDAEQSVEEELPLEPSPSSDLADAADSEPASIDERDALGNPGRAIADSPREPDVVENADDALAMPNTDSTVSRALDPSTVAARGEADDVVERFIQYDVGRLRGAEGDKARQDFGRLGVSAIPALVRGLNRAAMMSQSCPVVVIRGKLQYELQRCGDPSLIDYAKENIGRDVPHTAPHYAVIDQLRKDCPAVQLQRGAIVKVLRDNQLPDSEELVTRVVQLSHAEAGSLAAAMEHGDSFEKLAAAVAVCETHPAVRVEYQVRMGYSLTKLLMHRHPGIRRVAHRALVTLSGGADFGPRTDDSQVQVAEAQMRWNAAWQRRQTFLMAECDEMLGKVSDDGQVARQLLARIAAQDTSNLRPEQRVKIGRFLTALYGDDDAGIRVLARDAMVTVSNEFGDGDNRATSILVGRDANQAYWRDYWNQYEVKQSNESRARSMLAMAQALAGQGNMPAARRRFRQIVEQYPDTLAAATARQQIGSAY